MLLSIMSYTNKTLINDIKMPNGEMSAVAKSFIPAGTLLGIHGGDVVEFPIVNNRIVHKTVEHKEIVQICINDNTLLGLVSPKDEIWSGIDFINHSCNPSVAARDRIVIYALTDIKEGQELTMDYREWDLIPEGIQCWCKNKQCSI